MRIVQTYEGQRASKENFGIDPTVRPIETPAKHNPAEFAKQNGMALTRNKNGWTVFWLHYSADPERDEKWAKESRNSYLDQDTWNREMELDFSAKAGRRVYPGFRRDLHIDEGIKYKPSIRMVRGWDFGFIHPACVFLQITDDDDVLILGEVMGQDKVIEAFGADVITYGKEHFPSMIDWDDYGDVAGKQKSDKSKRTTADTLWWQYQIKIRSRYMHINDGVDMIRRILQPVPSGVPGQYKVRFKIHPRCKILIDGFLGGYQLNESNEPIHDYYSHISDALRYPIGNIFNQRTLHRGGARLYSAKRAVENAWD